MSNEISVWVRHWLLQLVKVIQLLRNLIPAIHVVVNFVIIMSAALIGLLMLSALERIIMAQNEVFSIERLQVYVPQNNDKFTLVDDLVLQSAYLRDKDLKFEDNNVRQQPLAELTYDGGWYVDGYSDILVRYVAQSKDSDDDNRMRLNTHRVLLYAPQKNNTPNSLTNKPEQTTSVGFSHAGKDIKFKIEVRKLKNEKWQISISDQQLQNKQAALNVKWPIENNAQSSSEQNVSNGGHENIADQLNCVSQEVGWAQNWQNLLKAIAPTNKSDGKDRTIAILGGPVPCIREHTRYQIGIAGLQGGSVAIVENSGFIFLVRGSAANLSARGVFSAGVFADDASNQVSRPIAQQSWPVDHDIFERKLQRILLGQTTFRVSEGNINSPGRRPYLEFVPEQFYVNALVKNYNFWLSQLPLDVAVSIQNPDDCNTDEYELQDRISDSASAKLIIACNVLHTGFNHMLIIKIVLWALAITLIAYFAYLSLNSRRVNASGPPVLIPFFLFFMSSTITFVVFIGENYPQYYEYLKLIFLPNLVLIDKVYLIGLSWCITTLVLFFKLPRSTSAMLLWFVTSFLMFAGQVILAELAFGANTELTLDYYKRNIVPLGFFNTGVLLALIIDKTLLYKLIDGSVAGSPPDFYNIHSNASHAWERGWGWFTGSLLWFRSVLGYAFLNVLSGTMLVMVVAMVLIWVMFGNEEGVSRIIQPSEFVKFSSFYFMSLAFVLAAHRNRLRNLGPNILLLIIIVVIYAVQIALPVLNSDFSPVLIMATTAVFLAPLFAVWFMIVAFAKYVSQKGDNQGDVKLPKEALGLVRVHDDYRSNSFLNIILRSMKRFMGWLYQLFAKAFWWPVFFILFIVAIGYNWEMDRWPENNDHDKLITFADEARGCGVDHSPFDTELLNGLCNTKFFSRIASALDMSFGRQQSNSNAYLEFVDEGAQVRLSRAAIGNAPCLPPSFKDLVEIDVPFAPDNWLKTASDLGVLTLDSAALVACPDILQSQLPAPTDQNYDQCGNHLHQLTSSKQVARAPDFGCPSAVTLNSIPVVQSDFIGAFILGRFGIVFTMAVILAQFIVLLLGMWIGFSVFRSGFANRTPHSRRQLLSFLCIGGTLMIGLQWTISWSNVFGALPVTMMAMPVMGQPMSFIAYASSHIVLMIMPIYMILYISIRLNDLEPDIWQIGIPPDIGSQNIFSKMF